MKKIMNDPSNVVSEMVAGLVSAYPTYLTQLPETTAVVRADRASMQGKLGSSVEAVVAMSQLMLVLLVTVC